jgi:outer membrane protein W
MSVYMTMRLSVDPGAFEKAAADHSDVIDDIMAIAKSNGLIAHRWLRGDGQVMAVDEWPDAASAQAFLGAAESKIGPFLGAAGVAGPPDVTFWDPLAIGDVVG